eukprot:jgi/Mesvir1/23722/Mv18667-RA.1
MLCGTQPPMCPTTQVHARGEARLCACHFQWVARVGSERSRAVCPRSVVGGSRVYCPRGTVSGLFCLRGTVSKLRIPLVVAMSACPTTPCWLMPVIGCASFIPGHPVPLQTSLGYFLLDFALVVRHFPHLGDRNMLYHHVLALVSCISGTLQVQGHAFITACLATEFTTPFLNNRWYLDKTGRKTHSIYVINGFGIWLSWLVVRVFMMFLLFVKMWVYLEEIRMTPGICQFLVLLTPTSLFFLNMFWFYKITLGLMKAVRASMNLPPRAGKKVE